MSKTWIFAVVLAAGCLHAQPADDTLAKLRALELNDVAGHVRLLYSKGVEERALPWHKAVSAARDWFEEQLPVRFPVTMAVLNSQDWDKVTNIVLPHVEPATGLILLREKPENLASRVPPKVDFLLADEMIAIHELGHLYAYSLKIGASNPINELVANIFAAAYIRAQRPDLAFTLSGPATFGMVAPRYTSLADYTYLYLRKELSAENSFWFQSSLQHLADVCVRGRTLPSVVAKLQAAFPAGQSYQLQVQETVAQIDGLFPGFQEAAGILGEPSSMPPLVPVSCKPAPEQDASANQSFRLIVLRNNTDEAITITRQSGSEIRANPHAWRWFEVPASAPPRLPDGRCLPPLAEPGLYIMEKTQAISK